MAIKNNLEDDQLEQQGQAAGGLNTSGVTGTSAGLAGGTGQAPGDTSQAPTASGFVNLDKYLAANDGAGAGLAANATKGLSDQVTSYGDSAKSTAANGQGAINKQAADYTNTAANLNFGIAKNASGTLGDAQKFLGANYGGPAASDYTTQLRVDGNKINANLKQVDDNAYQQDLLKKAYDGKDGQAYGPGFGNLDSFLIGGQQGGRDVINGVKGKTADVDQAYSNADSALQGSEAAARSALTSGQSGLKSNAHNLYSQRDQGFSNQVAQKNAGLTYANKSGVQQYGAGDFASGDDLANLQALASLSGDNFDYSKYAQKGGNEGVDIPLPAKQAESQTSGGGGDPTGFGRLGSTGAAISDTTKKAGSDIAGSVKQPSNPTIQAPNPIQAVSNYVAPRLKKKW